MYLHIVKLSSVNCIACACILLGESITPTPSVVPDTSSHHDGNATGLIIGCLFGFIVCAILILLTLFFFKKWKQKKQKQTHNATLRGMYSISDAYMYIYYSIVIM